MILRGEGVIDSNFNWIYGDGAFNNKWGFI